MASRFVVALTLLLSAALVIPATAATPKAGSWSGQTRQDKSISFTVTPEGKKVKQLKFGYKGNCDNGGRVSGTVSLKGKFPVNDGHFKVDTGTTVVKGEFTSKKKAEGTLKTTSSTFDPFSFRTVECRSGKVRWNAHR